MPTKNRASFGSRLGIIFASVGSAVGLGNIWRFPYETGQNGGGAFLLVYIICVLCFGFPLMMTEFFIGRHTRSNAVGAFRALTSKRGWRNLGYVGVLAAFLILGFYSVVSGWTLEYIWQALSGSLSGKTAEMFMADFEAFSGSIVRPILWLAIFLVITHLIIISGVRKGIEQSAKWMMPLLFLILIVLCIRSLTLPGAKEGLQFLFQPDFSKISSGVVLSALGQAFFSLSIGAACMITYSSYFTRETNIPKTALSVTLLDTMVAILAGIIIFPAVFNFGIAPTQGPNLVFVTLPNIFEQLPWGSVWAFFFFLLLALAALTSVISLHESVTAYVEEQYNLTRSRAALWVSGSVFVLGIVASLSIGIWKAHTLFGLTLFDLLDYTTAKILMPLGSMLVCLFIGWLVDRKTLQDDLTNQGKIRMRLFPFFVVFLKYIAPIIIALIFLNEIGLF